MAGWSWRGWAFAALELSAAYVVGRQESWWWLAAVVVVVIELKGLRRGSDAAALWERLPGLIVGLSVVLIITLSPRLATQVGAAVLYAVWLAWREREPAAASTSLVHLLIVQAVMFEAIFLMAAIWHTPSGASLPAWFILGLVWAGAYLSVYAALTRRGDRSAGVMAATWAVIATEVSWVLMLWLITYTMRGGYVLVPQPALILTALAYIFGSIVASSRQGNLSRSRLGEYIVIAAVLVMIVVLGTSWRGNI